MRPVAIYKDPPTLPHVCIKCGAHAQIREWFVDIGTEVEWEGIVYICNSCMSDIVQVTPDFLSVEAHTEIVAEYKNRMEEFEKLKFELQIMEDLWADLTGMGLRLWIDTMVKVKELGHELELSRTVSSATTDLSTVVGDSTESKQSIDSSDESDTITNPIILFS